MSDPVAALRHLPGAVRLKPAASGLYRYQKNIPLPGLQWKQVTEELRVDVDGRHPQMTVSGTSFPEGAILWRGYRLVHWVARVTASGSQSWKGEIWYVDAGTPADFPFDSIEVEVGYTLAYPQTRATVRFSNAAGARRERAHEFVSPHFRTLAIEVDVVQGVAATTSFDTATHPNRPASLPAEVLTLDTVYRRAGFDVSVTLPDAAGALALPRELAGADPRWTADELHDAMQVHWSAYQERAQWAVWLLFATRFYSDIWTGIMFDTRGQQRQGAALFMDNVGGPPAGPPEAQADWTRGVFSMAVHEIGHALNLAHSFQKELVGTSWIDLGDDASALSFMNYASRFDDGAGATGHQAFYSRFEYRFSDEELLFLRHAPEAFVQPGNATLFEDHGYRVESAAPDVPLALELHVNRPERIYEFLEPVVIDVTLSNRSAAPVPVQEEVLEDLERLVIRIARDGDVPRMRRPYCRPCLLERKSMLAPGASMQASLFVSAGLDGWQISDPGFYTLQASLALDGTVLHSPLLRIRVAPPLDYAEQYLAQDVFQDDVGRVLAFGGSAVLVRAMDVLEQAAGKLRERRIGRHASAVLANAAARPRKVLVLPEGKLSSAAARAGARIVLTHPDVAEATRYLEQAFGGDRRAAAETFGELGLRRRIEALGQHVPLPKEDSSRQARS